MHLDAMAVAVVDRAMDERADVEIAAEFAVDAMKHIEIEARSDAGRVVIGIVERALILLEVDADHHASVLAENRAGSPEELAGLAGFEIAERRAGKKSNLGHRADGVRQ